MSARAEHADGGPEHIVPLSAEGLNRDCSCRSLDALQLRRELGAIPILAEFAETIGRTRPYLFSAMAVFIRQEQRAQNETIVAAVERVAVNPLYRDAALSRAPAVTRHDFGPRGVFMGFDFHPTPQGPQLIEVNTNAGGALLNLALARAQHACCSELEAIFEPAAGRGRRS